jgi:hypothetical protein
MLKTMPFNIVLNLHYKKCNPGLLFLFIMLPKFSMANKEPLPVLSDTIPPQILTVANIASPRNTDFYEITFYESARFYKLMRNNKNCNQALILLKQSKKTNKPVLVILTEKIGAVIEDVRRK